MVGAEGVKCGRLRTVYFLDCTGFCFAVGWSCHCVEAFVPFGTVGCEVRFIVGVHVSCILGSGVRRARATTVLWLPQAYTISRESALFHAITAWGQAKQSEVTCERMHNSYTTWASSRAICSLTDPRADRWSMHATAALPMSSEGDMFLAKI